MPSWIAIGVITFLGGFLSNSLITRREFQWFLSLRRPKWLTFEWAIPFIWTTIFICAASSAYLVWEKEPNSLNTWLFMGGYLALEAVTMSYTPALIKFRSLKLGTAIGGTGAVIGILLAIAVFPVSIWAALLLLPYVLWSPIGTYTTWVMVYLNPQTK
ncbi:tryptophan-rich sensory protein [Tumidithrix helvetica PCC 7403]|uniref:TspO/MBR family protein n=1 Tax=Tumidithrix helvetica TaxID=3457545 RepID=UPI003CA245A8